MRRVGVWVAAVLVALTGWLLVADPGAPQTASTTSAESVPHTHTAGGGAVSLLVGDGIRSTEVGYHLTEVRVPSRAGRAGTVSFKIEDFRGRPVRHYIVDQTKKLHLYVVRTDLGVFRHLHPTQDADGTWSARVTLPEPGDYRVIAEFVARDGGGDGDFIMLGARRTVPGAWKPEPVPDRTSDRIGDDGSIRISAEGRLEVGPNGRMQLDLTDEARRPLELGSYLGTSAHVTGFRLPTGQAVHMHPLGSPEVDSKTRLTFHAQFELPGDYRLFVQVRVDGMLHTVPLTVTVHPPSQGS